MWSYHIVIVADFYDMLLLPAQDRWGAIRLHTEAINRARTGLTPGTPKTTSC